MERFKITNLEFIFLFSPLENGFQKNQDTDTTLPTPTITQPSKLHDCRQRHTVTAPPPPPPQTGRRSPTTAVTDPLSQATPTSTIIAAPPMTLCEQPGPATICEVPRQSDPKLAASRRPSRSCALFRLD
ncbi:hypothetical protein L484_010703 [Morus notabilis]|uniref:Uncharacterized protein n=1 Tax=Morus notabilis TaxID=981085 RepID=W9S759_9ROSA|nr:hypothetical protein L484_010703 [Morus notabilis]